MDIQTNSKSKGKEGKEKRREEKRREEKRREEKRREEKKRREITSCNTALTKKVRITAACLLAVP